MKTPTWQTLENGQTASIGEYRYRIKSTGQTSRKYGACEVCNKWASEVYVQAEFKCYAPLSFAYGRTIFGHCECLIKVRANPFTANYPPDESRNKTE